MCAPKRRRTLYAVVCGDHIVTSCADKFNQIYVLYIFRSFFMVRDRHATITTTRHLKMSTHHGQNKENNIENQWINIDECR